MQERKIIHAPIRDIKNGEDIGKAPIYVYVPPCFGGFYDLMSRECRECYIQEECCKKFVTEKQLERIAKIVKLKKLKHKSFEFFVWDELKCPHDTLKYFRKRIRKIMRKKEIA